MAKQHVVFESASGKAQRAASPRVSDLLALIETPPSDLEQRITLLAPEEKEQLLAALVIKVSALQKE